MARQVCIAHTRRVDELTEFQSLEDHLAGTAELAAGFGQFFDAGDWAHLAGLWHDLGKSSADFQSYIRAAAAEDSHRLETLGRVDHSTAGAQFANRAIPGMGHILAYTIAGHHAGLLDAVAPGSCQWSRLKKQVSEYTSPDTSGTAVRPLQLPPKVAKLAAKPDRFAFTLAFFTRMVFSCLVDADFLDTEKFMDPGRAAERSQFSQAVLPGLEKALEDHIGSFTDDGSTVYRARQDIHKACVEAAELPPGFFSLTVPTGGGKTLSSLAFALRHMRLNGLRRVIYAVPFTSIIEQNAEVFRRVLDTVSSEVVLEHHCNAMHGPDQDRAARMAAENWEPPVVVTTTVQFYESLFSNRPSRCRKLHNIARSVVILDEVQSIPVGLLKPILRSLEQLVQAYDVTVVLCTATQPAVLSRRDFPIGIDDVHEIIPDPDSLYGKLARVRASSLGKVLDEELVASLLEHHQTLCIVNTRSHARELFAQLSAEEGAVHLSAQMCPAHRSKVLEGIHQKLKHGKPCRLVSTQLIEAGVDIDFPVVYRAIAGLDSIAQAAGRCNRNGKLPKPGQLFLFESEHTPRERFLSEMTNVAAQILPLYDSPLSLQALDHYFRQYYWEQSSRWDERGIMGMVRKGSSREGELPLLFDFQKTAQAFRLLEQSACTVIVPWGERGKQLCLRLRHGGELPPRDLLRQLQRFQVGISEREYLQHLGREIELVHNRFAVLIEPQINYSEEIGLTLDQTRGGFLNI